MTKKIVLVESEKTPLGAVKEALKDGGYDIATCKGGFDALDELASEGADILISATELSDFSGYQLSCLVKSTDRTAKLPVVLVNTDGPTADEFWTQAAQADSMIDLKDLKTDRKKLATVITELIETGKQSGWAPAQV